MDCGVAIGWLACCGFSGCRWWEGSLKTDWQVLACRYSFEGSLKTCIVWFSDCLKLRAWRSYTPYGLLRFAVGWVLMPDVFFNFPMSVSRA